MIIIDDIEQGSQEWFDARIGIPTASTFDKIIGKQGKISTQREKFMYGLVGEKIIGNTEEGYTSKHMEAGIEREEEARVLFEMMTDLEVSKVGMCYYDEKKDRACSPDGLILDKKEGLEIKCPKLSTHVEYLLKGKLPTTYFAQVMGSMYITGYDKWHFMSYFPGMKPFHIVVERDEIWIAKLSKALDDFNVALDEVYIQLKED